MSIPLHCEKCGASLKAKDEDQGIALPCPKCQNQIHVPILAGPCPICQSMMLPLGRALIMSVLSIIVGGFVAVAGMASHGHALISWGIFILGAGVGLLGAVQFFRQRTYECPDCGTVVLSNRRVNWTTAGGQDCCLVCGGPMSGGVKRYRLIAIVYFALAACVLLPAIRHLAANGFAGAAALGLATAIAVGFASAGYARLRLHAKRCNHCGLQILSLPVPVSALVTESSSEPDSSTEHVIKMWGIRIARFVVACGFVFVAITLVVAVMLPVFLATAGFPPWMSMRFLLGLAIIGGGGIGVLVALGYLYRFLSRKTVHLSGQLRPRFNFDFLAVGLLALGSAAALWAPQQPAGIIEVVACAGIVMAVAIMVRRKDLRVKEYVLVAIAAMLMSTTAVNDLRERVSLAEASAREQAFVPFLSEYSQLINRETLQDAATKTAEPFKLEGSAVFLDARERDSQFEVRLSALERFLPKKVKAKRPGDVRYIVIVGQVGELRSGTFDIPSMRHLVAPVLVYQWPEKTNVYGGCLDTGMTSFEASINIQLPGEHTRANQLEQRTAEKLRAMLGIPPGE